MQMFLQAEKTIQLRDYDSVSASKANDDIQNKIDRLKEDISKFIMENNKELGFALDKTYMFTDKIVTFQPIPFRYNSFNGQIEFLCDDINFWLMVMTYELYESTEYTQRQQSVPSLALQFLKPEI